MSTAVDDPTLLKVLDHHNVALHQIRRSIDNPSSIWRNGKVRTIPEQELVWELTDQAVPPRHELEKSDLRHRCTGAQEIDPPFVQSPTPWCSLLRYQGFFAAFARYFPDARI